MTTVYVTDPISPEVYEALQEKYTIYRAYGAGAVSWNEVASQLEAVIVRTENVSAVMLESAPRLQIVARHGAGFDNVDVEAASRQGVWVTITPGANAQAVAEHVFALALSSARNTVEGTRTVADGEWRSAKPRLVGTQLHGKVIGVIGFGQIGRRVAKIARGFGMSVSVVDPFLSEADVADEDVHLTQLNELLDTADVLTLHVPLVDSNFHMIDAQGLARMKDGAIIINTSRGGLIDESALEVEIKAGRLNAGLDVIEGEAVNMNDPLPYSRIEVNLPGLVITPHIAGQTEQSMIDVGMAAMKCVDEAISGTVPNNAINRDRLAPQVTRTV